MSAPSENLSILDAPVVCTACGYKCAVRDAEPCAGGGTGLGCPLPDCGGIMRADEEP